MKKLIFDIGCNQGQNFEYFLKKSDYIIGIEANPKLCKEIRGNFSNEIKKEQLIIVNKIITNSNKTNQNFYISKKKNVLSQFGKPHKINDFNKINVDSVRASNLIKYYKNKYNIIIPYYIKIDIEHHDWVVLKDLLNNNIYAEYLSVEVQTPEVIQLILNSNYKSFKILEGNKKLNNIYIRNKDNKKTKYTFDIHSSGPFGNDIPGNWLKKNDLLPYFLNYGLGWKDICCSRRIEEYQRRIYYNQKVHDQGFRYHLKKIFPSFLSMIKIRIKKLFQ
jgi:hypothetical protein